MMVGSDLFPAIAAINGAIHAVERAGNDCLGIGRRKLQSANGLTAHSTQRLPRLTAVGRAEYIAGVVVDYAPGGDIDLVRIGGIDSDVVEDVIISRAKMHVAHPAGATINRKK